MSESYNDKGHLVVDFSRPKHSKKDKERVRYTEYDNIDLASGYPKDQIWVTKDGRRIAIPNMSDSHLLNTIALLRRHEERAKMRQLCDQLLGIQKHRFVWDMFELAEHEEEVFAQAIADRHKVLLDLKEELFNMPEDAYLREHVPQFKYMLREAYKRKLLIEVDKTKLTGE